MKIIKIITAFLVIVVSGCSSGKDSITTPDNSPKTSYEIGKSEAESMLSQGNLCWKLCGQPAAHDQLFKQVLKVEYKVDLLIVAGCKVPDKLGQNVRGYNEIMAKAIAERFGENIIPLAEEQARQQFEDQNKKAQPVN